MKIAVISDIHGNIDALNRVMDDIRNKECDKIFALGDYAMAGPDPSEVVNFFMRKKNNENLKMINELYPDVNITKNFDELLSKIVSTSFILIT